MWTPVVAAACVKQRLNGSDAQGRGINCHRHQFLIGTEKKELGGDLVRTDARAWAQRLSDTMLVILRLVWLVKGVRLCRRVFKRPCMR
jgi:hypothetical protein